LSSQFALFHHHRWSFLKKNARNDQRIFIYPLFNIYINTSSIILLRKLHTAGIVWASSHINMYLHPSEFLSPSDQHFLAKVGFAIYNNPI
jgi:hypothetical protein